MSLIETEIQKGEPWQVGGNELTPISQVLKVQIPGYHIGGFWNRPKAVVVRSPDGREQVLPVIDYTRVAIWAMLAGGLFGAIIMSILYRIK